MRKVTMISFHSLCGYYTKLAFENFDDSDIEYVEQFTRTKLPGLMKSSDNNADDASFFGSYLNNTREFQFSPDEKNLIHRFAGYIQRQSDEALSTANCQVESDEAFCDGFTDVISENKPTSTKSTVETITFEKKDTRTHRLLYKMLELADKNADRSKNGYRFDNDIANGATAFRILTGPSVYNMLQWNLNLALPSLSSTNRLIGKYHNKQIEGQLAITELSQYLDQRNLPRQIALSEDATRVVSRIQYDSRLNEIIGFVLPQSVETGMPVPHYFSARSASEICKHFNGKNDPAHFANVIMAQPLAKCPPFCLLLFGTNGQYSAEDIANRWDHITAALADANIEVITVSTDSDQKQNSAMRKCSGLGVQSSVFDKLGGADWFGMNVKAPPFYFLDIPHLALNFRNCLLKTKTNLNKLRFGSHYIRIQHLEFLLNHFSKDQHQLTATTLNPLDKQNFQSLLRLCDDKVINLLKLHVTGSNGTVTFLQIIRNIVDAFMDPNLSPLQRVKKMWHVVFILRIWRSFVVSNGSLNLTTNFLTVNSYSCLEINAHSLILIILYLKERNLDDLFLPHLFNSQPCESFFRKIRSMTSTYCTITNCSIKEMLGRINRISMLDDSALHTEIAFPRISKTQKHSGRCEYKLPSINEIFDEIEKCKSDAIEFAIQIGLIKRTDTKNISLKCPINSLAFKRNEDEWEDWVDEEEDDDELIAYREEAAMQELQLESLLLPNHADKFIDQEILQSSPYVEIYHSENKRIVVKKTSLCWLLRPEVTRMSSDRLRRVQTKIILGSKRLAVKTPRRKKFKTNKNKRNVPKQLNFFKTKNIH